MITNHLVYRIMWYYLINMYQIINANLDEQNKNLMNF